MSRLTAVLGALFLSSVASGGFAGAGMSAGPPSCLVSNERTEVGARSLQEAIDEADSGDTLVVKGTCSGTSTIDKDLELKGVSNRQFGTPTLEGAGFGNPVLSIGSAFSLPAVKITGLTIEHGSAGGIESRFGVDLELTGSTVRANSGFGITLWGYGRTTLTNSIVSENTGVGIQAGSPGGIRVISSRVTDNSGSGLWSNGQEIIVDESIVSGNGGVGIYNALGPAARINNSTISGNSGSGISVFDASLILTDSIVTGNAATYGGGVLLNVNSFGSISNSMVSGNNASIDGGGIAAMGSGLDLDHVTIDGNTALVYGGGLYFSAGGNYPYLRLSDSAVINNTASSGGGIYFTPSDYGTVVLSGTNTFSGNVPEDCVGVSGC